MADLAAGVRLGERFEIVGVLGHGGMATVYLARDLVRGEQVALKVLHAHLAHAASMRSRLRREVSAAGRLRHPRALVALDLHDLDGRLAISMPLHPGHTLAEHVERHGPLTGAALERLALQLAEVLREAHGIGLVHRDVTPTNVMIDAHGDAVLMDFGLARFTDQRTATGTGALGTAGYAAPEVWSGQRADPRADLYGLGAVLYHAATGAAPFAGADPVAVLRRQLDDDRRPLVAARPDLPRHVAALVDALLAQDPDARPQGAAEVIEALRTRTVSAVAAGPSQVARPHLPPGPFTVLIEERHEDRARRKLLRQHEQRVPGSPQDQFARVVKGVTRYVVSDLLKLAPSHSPEERLAIAVARAAELPPDALAVPPAVYLTRFRLVEAVSEETAQRLARAAEEAGFNARPAATDAHLPRRGGRPPGPSGFDRRAMLAMMMSFGIAAFLAFGAVGTFPAWAWLLVAMVLLPAMLVLGVLFTADTAQRSAQQALPLAFGSDLRFHLSPDAKVTLPPPVSDPTAPRGAAASMAPRSPAPTRHGAVLERARAQLTAFAEAITAAEALPEPARRDLRGTLAELSDQVERLGRRAEALEAELARTDDAAAGAAVDRVERRLQRLRTLADGGQRDAAAEIRSLEDALTTHRAALEHFEEVDGHLTLVIARLLEVGAAAARARMTLLDTPEPARSADDLVERLKRETRAAQSALTEVAPRRPLRA